MPRPRPRARACRPRRTPPGPRATRDRARGRARPAPRESLAAPLQGAIEGGAVLQLLARGLIAHLGAAALLLRKGVGSLRAHACVPGTAQNRPELADSLIRGQERR